MSMRGNQQLALMVLIMTGITGALTYAAHTSEAVKGRVPGAYAGELVGELPPARSFEAPDQVYAAQHWECTTFVCDQSGEHCRVVPCK